MSDPFETDLIHTWDQEQASAEQPEASPPEASSALRARLVRLAVVAALVVAGVVVLVTTTGTGERSRARPGGPHRVDLEQGITGLLADIPQSSNALGRPTAPVILRWFGDLECPYCKEFALGMLPSLIRRWVRGGQLRIEYLSLKTATREPTTFKEQEIAALAAGMQDRMWSFIETFLHEQGEEGSGYVTDKYLRGIARQIPGMKEALWDEDRRDPALVARLAADRRLAASAGFSGTPSFLISRHGGAAHRLDPKSLTNPRQFDLAIEYLLDAERSTQPQYVLYPGPQPGGAHYFPSRPR